MKPAYRDLDTVIVAHPVDKTVLGSDPAGPPPDPLVPQRLRFPDPCVLIPGNILDELVDSLEDVAVLGLPVEIVLPSVIGKGDFHPSSSSAAASSRSCPPPSFNCSIEREIRRRFAGLAIRYRVSLMDSYSRWGSMTTFSPPGRVITTSSWSLITESRVAA